MKIKEIKQLRNIFEVKYANFSDYRTDCSVPDAALLRKIYHPIIISTANNLIYDYTETSKNYLRRPHITSETASNTFLDIASDTTIVYDISQLSIDQVQDIIDRNNYLFTQITN